MANVGFTGVYAIASAIAGKLENREGIGNFVDDAEAYHFDDGSYHPDKTVEELKKLEGDFTLEVNNSSAWFIDGKKYGMAGVSLETKIRKSHYVFIFDGDYELIAIMKQREFGILTEKNLMSKNRE